MSLPLTLSTVLPPRARVRWAGTGPVVVLSGEVDMECVPEVASAADLLRRWPERALVDAGAVSFIDVTGLRAVLGLAGADGRVVLVRPSAPVMRLLDVLGRADGDLTVVQLPGPSSAVAVTAVPGW